MSEIIKQRSYLKFCVRNQVSGVEKFSMLEKVFDDNCLSRASAFDWHKLFKEGLELIHDKQPGRLTTATDDQHVNKTTELVLKNRRLTVRDLTGIVLISEG